MDSNFQEEFPVQKDERNIEVARSHRKEFCWQILFPVVVFIIFLALGFSSILEGEASTLTSISQISTILILLPLILIALVLIFLTIAVVVLLAMAMKWIPPNAFWLQKQIKRANYRVQDVSDMAAEPFLRLDSWTEAASRIFDRFK